MKPDLCGGGGLSIDVRGLIGAPGEQRVLTGAPGGVLISARAEAIAGLSCSRCLAPLQQLITADFRHLFVMGREAEGVRPDGRERHEAEELRRSHADEDELDTSPITDGRIGVAPLVAEALE